MDDLGICVPAVALACKSIFRVKFENTKRRSCNYDVCLPSSKALDQTHDTLPDTPHKLSSGDTKQIVPRIRHHKLGRYFMFMTAEATMSSILFCSFAISCCACACEQEHGHDRHPVTLLWPASTNRL